MSTEDAETGKDAGSDNNAGEQDAQSDAAPESPRDDQAAREPTPATDAEPKSTTSQADASAETDPDDQSASDSESSAVKKASPASDAAEAPKAKAESDPDKADSGAKGKPGLIPVIAAFTAGVLLVGALTAVVVFFLQAKDRDEKLKAISESTDAACRMAKTVSSIDHHDQQVLEDFLSGYQTGTTGEIREKVTESQDNLKKFIIDKQIVIKPLYVECGYQSGDKENAKILIDLVQIVTSVDNPQPQPLPGSANFIMQKVDGQWLLAEATIPSQDALSGGGGAVPGIPGVPAPGGEQPPVVQPGDESGTDSEPGTGEPAQPGPGN